MFFHFSIFASRLCMKTEEGCPRGAGFDVLLHVSFVQKPEGDGGKSHRAQRYQSCALRDGGFRAGHLLIFTDFTGLQADQYFTSPTFFQVLILT